MGRAPFGTRWVDSNKGDDERQEYRSRLVVQETRKTSTIPADDIAAVTASTPPLEIVRLFCSLCMSLRGPDGEKMVMQFLDGARDAGQSFEFAVRDHFLGNSFTQGLSRPVCS